MQLSQATHEANGKGKTVVDKKPEEIVDFSGANPTTYWFGLSW